MLTALLEIGDSIVFSSLKKIVEEVDYAVAAAEKIDNSVAVLPFVNLDTNPDTGYFSDGVTEEILHRLSSLKALHILNQTSSFAFRNSNDGPARISELLGVRYLLHGSDRRDNNFVRVTARLIDDTGYQVWSETFDRKLEGIFAIQSEIANTVASHIERQIIPPAELPAGRTTTNMAAYDAYLVGRAFVNARTPGFQDKAIAAFEEAIRLDENYAPPYAGLAIASSLTRVESQADFESNVRAAETSLKLDPELAEGYAARGLMLLDTLFHYGGDAENKLARAETSLRRALDLDPTLTNAYNWLSNSLQQQGRYEEANAVQERGLLVNPLDPILSSNMARRLLRQGERDRAEQMLLRLTYLPEPPGGAYTGLAFLYDDTGQLGKSIRWAKRYGLASASSLTGKYSAFLAGRYEHLGLTEDADYWASDVMARTPQPAQRFLYMAVQGQIRGNLQGIQKEIDMLYTTLGTDMSGLQGAQATVYAGANIYVGNFDVGINVLESVFDLESISEVDDLSFIFGLGAVHLLAYAYQQDGQNDEATELLTRLHEQLNSYVVERKMDYGPLHHLRALNSGLRGDFDAAADALEAAIKVGWLRYFWVMNNPAWAETIADPRVARLLDDVKVELERQRAVVQQADAEHDFRAELEALRGAPGAEN